MWLEYILYSKHENKTKVWQHFILSDLALWTLSFPDKFALFLTNYFSITRKNIIWKCLKFTHKCKCCFIIYTHTSEKKSAFYYFKLIYILFQYFRVKMFYFSIFFQVKKIFVMFHSLIEKNFKLLLITKEKTNNKVTSITKMEFLNVFFFSFIGT